MTAAISLSEMAFSATLSSPSNALNLVHNLEIDCRNHDAVCLIWKFLEENAQMSVGKLVAGDVVNAWKAVRDAKEVKLAEETLSKGVPNLPTPDLDFFALLFVLVKLLFLANESVSKIGSVVRLIEPERNGWFGEEFFLLLFFLGFQLRVRDFHLTTVRNEHAYYCCAVQCLEVRSEATRDERPTVHVIGDSHCLPLAWNSFVSSARLHPHLVTGLKMWHLRPESVFFLKKRLIYFHEKHRNFIQSTTGSAHWNRFPMAVMF